jgi:hypothetical protein
MNQRSFLGVAAVLTLAVGLLPGSSALAQQKSLKEQLVGTWTFVSAADVQPDGTNVDRWGPNAKGMLIFDAGGRYMLMINRADLPKFTANRVDRGTAEENQAVMKGMIATFGTYSVNDADKTVMTQVEGGSFPNLHGRSQKRVIKTLTAEELKYANPATTTGASAEVTWRRAK